MERPLTQELVRTAGRHWRTLQGGMEDLWAVEGWRLGLEDELLKDITCRVNYIVE